MFFMRKTINSVVVRMSGKACPVLLAGLMGKGMTQSDMDKEAQCIRERCAWWNDKYGMCYVEMIMLRA